MNQNDRSWQQYYADEVRGSNDTIMSFLSHAIRRPEFQGDNTEAQYRGFLQSKEKLQNHVRDAANGKRSSLTPQLFVDFYDAIQKFICDERLAHLRPRLQAYLARYMEVATRAGLGPRISALRPGALPGPSGAPPASAGDRQQPSLPRIFSPVPVTVGGRKLDNDELTAVKALLALNPQPTSAAGGPAQHSRLTITLPPLHTLTSRRALKNRAPRPSERTLRSHKKPRTPPR